jgi:Methylase of polypeptide chain release factors
MILCNPPYISREEKQDLQDEVLIFDPEQALFSDKKGLADYEIIFSNLAKYLNSNGIALIEIGYNQLKNVSDLAYLSNLHVYNVFKDLQGIPRCMILCHPNNTVL